MNLENIDIIVSEVDGIITDGMKPIDHMNHTMFKNYCERDFDVINELKKQFTFVFLADDAAVSYNVMRTKNIPAFYPSSTGESKLSVLQHRIMTRYNMTPDNLLYIGNKFSDVPCMNYANLSATLTYSPSKLKQTANFLIESPAGHGVLCELYEILLPEILKRQRK